MRKSILVFLAVSLAGCGLFRKVQKASKLNKSVTSLEVKKDSTGLIMNRSVINIKEQLDTVIIVPRKEVNQDTYLNIDSLARGITAIKNDFVDVRLILNPVSGILSASAIIHPVRVPVNIDKVTSVKMDITKTGGKTEIVQRNSKSQDRINTVDKDIKSLPWYIIPAIGMIIMIGGIVGYRFLRR